MIELIIIGVGLAIELHLHHLELHQFPGSPMSRLISPSIRIVQFALGELIRLPDVLYSFLDLSLAKLVKETRLNEPLSVQVQVREVSRRQALTYVFLEVVQTIGDQVGPPLYLTVNLAEFGPILLMDGILY